MLLENKVAIVTGSTSGIGEDTARTFAKEGAKVVVSGRRAELGEKIAKEIVEAGGEAIFIQCDIAEPEQVKNLVEKTVEHYGRLDVAVNNAAASPDTKLAHEFDDDEMDALLKTDVKGTAECLKYELAQMIKQGEGGAIVNISSCITSKVQECSIGYISAKYGVIGMTEAACKEVGKYNIRVNAVRPGVIMTPMLMAYYEGMGGISEEYAASQIALGRPAQPVEVANACLMLCSDLASYISGAIIDVDGGYRHM